MCEAVPWEDGTMPRAKAGARDPETMQPFGEETSEQLASIPARIFVKQHARIKYASKNANVPH